MSTYARLYMSLTSTKDGKAVAGDVLDREFPAHIEVEDWDWKLTRPERREGQPDDARTKAGEFQFTKVMDRASTQMLRFLSSNAELNAVVTLVQTKDLTFRLVARLDKVRIAAYSFTAKDEEKNASIEENWTFKYESITLEHEPGIKDARAQSTTHLRSPSDNAKAAAAPAKSVVDDFKKLRKPDQLQAQNEIGSFMKGLSEAGDDGLLDDPKPRGSGVKGTGGA